MKTSTHKLAHIQPCHALKFQNIERFEKGFGMGVACGSAHESDSFFFAIWKVFVILLLMMHYKRWCRRKYGDKKGCNIWISRQTKVINLSFLTLSQLYETLNRGQNKRELSRLIHHLYIFLEISIIHVSFRIGWFNIKRSVVNSTFFCMRIKFTQFFPHSMTDDSTSFNFPFFVYQHLNHRTLFPSKYFQCTSPYPLRTN